MLSYWTAEDEREYLLSRIKEAEGEIFDLQFNGSHPSHYEHLMKVLKGNKRSLEEMHDNFVEDKKCLKCPMFFTRS